MLLWTIYKGEYDPKKACINNQIDKLLGAQKDKFYCLEPEQTQFGRSHSRFRDLKLPGLGANQKSGGSATQILDNKKNNKNVHSTWVKK